MPRQGLHVGSARCTKMHASGEQYTQHALPGVFNLAVGSNSIMLRSISSPYLRQASASQDRTQPCEAACAGTVPMPTKSIGSQHGVDHALASIDQESLCVYRAPSMILVPVCWIIRALRQSSHYETRSLHDLHRCGHRRLPFRACIVP